MSHSHKCPFCQTNLRLGDNIHDAEPLIWEHYFCDADGCMNDDMPRYTITYRKVDGKKISCSFMIESYYVEIDWDKDDSIISTLDGVMLIGSISLPRALELDMTDLNSVKQRIKTLLLFS